jgi:hypothetical protein
MLDKYRTITYKNAKKIKPLETCLNSDVNRLCSGLGQPMLDRLLLPVKKLLEAALC